MSAEPETADGLECLVHQLARALSESTGFFSRRRVSCQHPMVEHCMCPSHISERAEEAITAYELKFPPEEPPRV